MVERDIQVTSREYDEMVDECNRQKAKGITIEMYKCLGLLMSTNLTNTLHNNVLYF